MALIVRWWCAWLSVLFVVFIGNAVGLSHPDGSYYSYLPDQAVDDDGAYFQNLDGTPLVRLKRYLAGEYSNQQFDKEEATNVSPVDDYQSSMKGIAPVIPENLKHVDVTSTTKIPDATRLLSSPVNTSESKTGGNYFAAETENVTNNNSATNLSDMNRTSQSKNVTPAVKTVSPPNQMPVVHQPENTTHTVMDILVNNTSSVVLPPRTTASSTTSSTYENITITEIPEDLSNKTLNEHNITSYQEDNHIYYNSTFISNNEDVGQVYWVNMANRTDVLVNKMLSQSHRRAATVKLSFDFPFYGHVVRNVTIATGGFLYTGDYVHSWLAATQYIAPLMANFDTSLSPDSYVKYVDNGTAFTVQWDKVRLKDKPESGDFTFQATLYNTGDIVFVYQSVPVVIDDITDEHHPVKVGLSDAYIIDRIIFFVRRKTIYEYHRVNFDRQSIKNWTVIYLNALSTCLDGLDCEYCTSHVSNFNCMWCPGVKRCSNGVDRFRQDWLMNNCDTKYLHNVTECPSPEETPAVIYESPTQSSIVGQDPHTDAEGTPDIKIHDITSSVSVSNVVGILFLVALLMSTGLWILYAYRNPHTASGQFLIKYRPSQWSWKRGEARYTAATIHM